MARTYTKAKRAEQEAETRNRIAEAALALHAEHGPAATTISMIAERAGVQRHTVYAHYPDDLSLQMACSGLFTERNPIPPPSEWDHINDPLLRIRTALVAVYEWYARSSGLTALVLRDAERSDVTRQVTELRMGPGFAAIGASLSAGLEQRGRAAVQLALSFYTWRTLTQQAGLSNDAAADLMAEAVLATGGRGA